jgi:hypothetical protein
MVYISSQTGAEKRWSEGLPPVEAQIWRLDFHEFGFLTE